jgi:hypothetical protein
VWLTTRRTITAKLAGKGTGTARITLERVNDRVCFKLSWAGIGSPVAAHIHDGHGAAILPLFVDGPKRQGCVKAPKSLIKKIAEAPHCYHLQLTTERHPAGALRGRL